MIDKDALPSNAPLVAVPSRSPIHQNPLSGECGIMSIVNSYRLLHPKVFGGSDYESLKACEHLYCHLIAAAPRHVGSSLKTLVMDGTNQLSALAIESTKYVWKTHALDFRSHKTSLRKNRTEAVKPPTSHRAWVVGLEDHWSVVWSFSGRVARFYDSYSPEPLTWMDDEEFRKELKQLIIMEMPE